MKSKFRRLFIGLVLGATLFGGIAELASVTAQTQNRRRVIIVRRPIHRRFYDPFWDPWRFDRFDRARYSRYVFDIRKTRLTEATRMASKSVKATRRTTEPTSLSGRIITKKRALAISAKSIAEGLGAAMPMDGEREK